MRHFVTFYSPGIVPEEITQTVEAWDIETAKRLAPSIAERYGVTPYGFQFTTCGDGPMVISPFYELEGKGTNA